MPELPDVTVYVERLVAHVGGRVLRKVRLKSPFLLRSVDPPLSAVEGRAVREVQRLGKRIVFGFDDGLFLVLHLMIAGRLRWRKPGAGLPGKIGLAAFDFDDGTLVLTEAASRKKASLHVVRGEDALAAHGRGGLEVLGASDAEFAAALTRERHTLKRTLTDPRLFSGIGNAYSDEILHRAKLSPFKLSTQLDDDERARLRSACETVLVEFTERLRAEVGDGFPDKVTAFRPDMAVHGRYGEPCPACGAPVQRILYAENECNYCVTCQTGGKLLADRVLSRLMKDDWPRTLEELEELRGG
ncbi:MAG: formamidopyrimidine-DNA glycosylase [Planctomycetes bacterium]|nr:formamidopyrimidine-DNA glycosylase [Planctomycetota bacterium]